MENKTIKVSIPTWKKLMKWRIDLGCKNLDEVVDRILNIIPAKELTIKTKQVGGDLKQNQSPFNIKKSSGYIKAKKALNKLKEFKP